MEEMFQVHSLRLGYLSGQLGLARVPSALLILWAQPAGAGCGDTCREKQVTGGQPQRNLQGEPPSLIRDGVIIKCGGRGQPESSVLWLESLFGFAAFLEALQWLVFPTIPIHVMAILGKRVASG